MKNLQRDIYENQISILEEEFMSVNDNNNNLSSSNEYENKSVSTITSIATSYTESVVSEKNSENTWSSSRVDKLRIGETIELKCPFMVPRLNLNEYWNDYLSGPDGSFLSVKVQETQACDLYHACMAQTTSRGLLWFSILVDFWLFSKWL